MSKRCLNAAVKSHDPVKKCIHNNNNNQSRVMCYTEIRTTYTVNTLNACNINNTIVKIINGVFIKVRRKPFAQVHLQKSSKWYQNSKKKKEKKGVVTACFWNSQIDRFTRLQFLGVKIGRFFDIQFRYNTLYYIRSNVKRLKLKQKKKINKILIIITITIIVIIYLRLCIKYTIYVYV